VSQRDLIFIAEDNPADVDLLKMALSKHGVHCDLTVFTDGSAALEAIGRAELKPDLRPDLFVIDLNLPKVDGISVLRRIRESLVFNHAPIMVWTTSDHPRDQLRSMEFGADTHVTKPGTLMGFLGLGDVIKGMLKKVAVPHGA